MRFNNSSKHGFGNKLYYASLCALTLMWLFLFFLGRGSYPGSVSTYDGFSLAFLLLLGSALDKRTSSSYFFLALFLWLGFWFKVTFHLVLAYPYVEPIGQFKGTADAWDEVLCTATISAIGVLSGGWLYRMVKAARTAHISLMECRVVQPPAWYEAHRKMIWMLVVTTVFGITFINVILGIHQIGLIPRTFLIWPFNAVIAWMVNIGCTMMVATVAWWELSMKKGNFWATLFILLTAFISSISVLSRGVFLFQSIPQLISLYRNRSVVSGFTQKRAAILVVLIVGMLAVAIAGVTTLRGYLYPHAGGFTTESQIRMTRLEVLEGGIGHIQKLIDQGENRENELQELIKEKAALEDLLSVPQSSRLIQSNQHPSANSASPTALAASLVIKLPRPAEEESVLHEFVVQLQGQQIKTVLQLAADRWIGMEGLMAVTAYPEKSFGMMFKALLEQRHIGKATFYQGVSNSSYRFTDASTWQFASLPGAAAFLYYSGSLWTVLFGMALFTLLISFAESFIFSTTANPLISSLLGFAMANTVAQFGVTPRQDVPHYFMIFIAVLLIGVVRSDRFSNLLVSTGVLRCGKK